MLKVDRDILVCGDRLGKERPEVGNAKESDQAAWLELKKKRERLSIITRPFTRPVQHTELNKHEERAYGLK